MRSRRCWQSSTFRRRPRSKASLHSWARRRPAVPLVEQLLLALVQLVLLGVVARDQGRIFALLLTDDLLVDASLQNAHLRRNGDGRADNGGKQHPDPER